MHGDPPERIAPKFDDMAERREKPGLPPMKFGVAAYAIVRDTEAEAQAGARAHHRRAAERRRATGITSNGSPTRSSSSASRSRITPSRIAACAPGWSARREQVADRIGEFEAAGVDLLLLQCSPQLEEMERFAELVIKPSASAHRTATRA